MLRPEEVVYEYEAAGRVNVRRLYTGNFKELFVMYSDLFQELYSRTLQTRFGRPKTTVTFAAVSCVQSSLSHFVSEYIFEIQMEDFFEVFEC
jgi:hypothetical protein